MNDIELFDEPEAGNLTMQQRRRIRCLNDECNQYHASVGHSMLIC